MACAIWSGVLTFGLVSVPVELTTSVVPARSAAIARMAVAVTSGCRYMVTPSQFQVARAGIPRSPVATADRSAATNLTLAGSASPARRSAARFHA